MIDASFLEHIDVHEYVPADRPARLDDLAVVPTPEHHGNHRDGVHGGLVATMLDSAMGRAARRDLNEEQGVATVSMTVIFLAPARMGVPLRAAADVRKGGSRLITVQGDIVQGGDDTLIATGVATYAVVDRA